MATKKKTVIDKIATKTAQKMNSDAFKFYIDYKKAKALLSEAELVSGKGFYTDSAKVGSTLNFEINRYGILSTTQVF